MKTIAHCLTVYLILCISVCSLGAEPKEVNDKLPVSKLVGNWSLVLDMGGEGPTHIHAISIKKDGAYYWVATTLRPKKFKGEDDEYHPYDPQNVADVRIEKGKIDLRTGNQVVAKEDRDLSVISVTWTVKNGRLKWDMGGMGGQGMTFFRASED